MNDIQLTKHFKLSEFYKNFDKLKVTDELINDRLFCLSHFLLEPIREYAGCPIIITSGYRTKLENIKTPGAAASSLHTKGLAADFVLKDNHPLYLEGIYEFIKEQLPTHFCELIRYVDAEGKLVRLHVALSTHLKPNQYIGEKPA